MTAPTPVGPANYNTATISCDMHRLYDDGGAVVTDAEATAQSLETIVTTLSGLKEAGAWLGPASDDAQGLFDQFDAAAKALFGEQPLGILPLIGGNLRVAAGNYDAGEKAIADMFGQFQTTGGGATAPTTDPNNPVVIGPHVPSKP